MKHTQITPFFIRQSARQAITRSALTHVCRISLGVMFCAGLLPTSHAQSEDVYLCINAQGQREYKNTGNIKGCKKVELMGLTTVPAPKPKSNPAPVARSSSPAASSTPSEFPKVDPAAQKARDSDSKRILQDELDAEEAKLASLKQEYKGGEPERLGSERNAAKYNERVQKMANDIANTEKNIESIKRELAKQK